MGREREAAAPSSKCTGEMVPDATRTKRSGVNEFRADSSDALYDALHGGRLLCRHRVNEHLCGVPRQSQRVAARWRALQLGDEVIKRAVDAGHPDLPLTHPKRIKQTRVRCAARATEECYRSPEPCWGQLL